MNERRDQSGISATPPRPLLAQRRRRSGRVQQPAEDPQPDPDRSRRRDRRDGRVGNRIAECGEEPDDAEGDEADRCDLEPPARDEAEQRAEGERDDDDEQFEGELVVGAEQGDDEVLRAGWLEVDDDLADRGHERRRAGSRPASSSETPSAAAVATIPATGAAQSRRRDVVVGRTGARDIPAAVLTAHHRRMS